ncbi:MAG: hypothetical protein H6981_06180 [Gammaproteobacteria bacterium]|nr:hypothetical protein [Gammaproteobacteria bacterium]MCP5136371.1 hypothetical protein [Gammaproteobacteria bacterium]
MKAILKAPSKLWSAAHEDLARRHPFAAERVGFFFAKAAVTGDGVLLLLATHYEPVVDEDYVFNPQVGAMIGSEAIRKAMQASYKNHSALIHVHSHGGRGRPEFSATDTSGAAQFVPSFFNAVPGMPHGIVVLSGDSARGLLWTAAESKPRFLTGFVTVGDELRRFGEER